HEISDLDFRRALLAGYPDRVGQRREPGSPRVRLASGAGATLGGESGVREAEFLVALDVHADARREARIRLASRVDREWLAPNASEIVHRFDTSSGGVKAFVIDRYDALVLGERPTKPDPEVAARMLAEAWRERGPAAADRRLLNRLRFAGSSIDVDDAIAGAAQTA